MLHLLWNCVQRKGIEAAKKPLLRKVLDDNDFDIVWWSTVKDVWLQNMQDEEENELVWKDMVGNSRRSEEHVIMWDVTDKV